MGEERVYDYGANIGCGLQELARRDAVFRGLTSRIEKAREGSPERQYRISQRLGYLYGMSLRRLHRDAAKRKAEGLPA